MYVIQELQTADNVTAVTPAVVKESKNEAESAFHYALGAAAVSVVPVHAVIMMDEHGNLIQSGYYEHPTA